MKTSYRELDYAYGEAMQQLRTAIGLTQARLADRLGVSWRTVAGWEAGSSYPRAEHLKALIAFAVQQQAFTVGHEAEEIRVLWKVAHQKLLLDEHWLSALLDQQNGPQEQAPGGLRPRVEPKPVEETITIAQVAKQESADEEPTELRMPSDQSSVVRSLHLTGLDAVTGQPQELSYEPLAETATPHLLPNGSFPQTPAKTKAPRPRRKLLMGILTALVILIIIGSAGTHFFQARGPASKTAIPGGYLSAKGTLVFFDPLSQADGSEWAAHSIDRGGGSCQFTGGAYHVSQQQSGGFFKSCPAFGIFTNFAFEVQLVIVQGDCAGMVLRDDRHGNFYYFEICQNGRYEVIKYVNDSGTNYKELSEGISGLSPHKLAVVANGSSMAFYVNEQQISRVQDSSYTAGYVTLTAGPYSSGVGHATDVAYSNARLWRL